MKLLVAYSLVALSLAAAGVIYISDHRPPTNKPVATARCEEDQPCWDCKSMGNRRCGVADVVITYDRWGNVTLIQRTENGKPVLTLFDIDLID